VVVTRDSSFAAIGVIAAPSIEKALAVARGDALRRGVREIMVIGGAEIYRQTTGIADRLVISEVPLAADGDACFPPIESDAWKQVSCQSYPAAPGDDAGFSVRVYERNSPAHS